MVPAQKRAGVGSDLPSGKRVATVRAIALGSELPMVSSMLGSVELYVGQRVAHWWTDRRGEVIKWYNEGQKAGKMWILFDDGEVELRWINAFASSITKRILSWETRSEYEANAEANMKMKENMKTLMLNLNSCMPHAELGDPHGDMETLMLNLDRSIYDGDEEADEAEDLS